MSWTSDAQATGQMNERDFVLAGANGNIPGVYWQPAGDTAPQAVVALGHGGTRHKKVDYIVGVAQLLAARGVASFAIDGPGHGERAPADLAPGPDAFSQQWNGGGGHAGMLADWRAAFDFVEAEFGARPTGWWGLSMGTMMGLPVCASDDRVQVALLGLMGNWGPNGKELAAIAPQLNIPVRFLVQWDDEIVPRDRCLDLFGLLASKRKSLHGNPGKHAAVPQFEVAASCDFLADKLLAG